MIPQEIYTQLTAQITNGTIDPNWVLVCLMGAVSVLLLRILNRIEKKLDDHELLLKDHEIRLAVMEKE
jgi:hypothetical protein